VKRFICDRCEKDITDLSSGHLSGVRESTDEIGNGTITEEAQLCRSCYSKFKIWFSAWMKVPFSAPGRTRRHQKRRTR
jgi:hypothetical protein